MYCFKNQTFCPFLECANKECDKRFTEQLKYAADSLDMMICLITKKPKCFITTKGEKE